jgi:hypothetical protein
MHVAAAVTFFLLTPKIANMNGAAAWRVSSRVIWTLLE